MIISPSLISSDTRSALGQRNLQPEGTQLFLRFAQGTVFLPVWGCLVGTPLFLRFALWDYEREEFLVLGQHVLGDDGIGKELEALSHDVMPANQLVVQFQRFRDQLLMDFFVSFEVRV